MTRPPLLLRVHVSGADDKGIRLWIPIFLLLPFFYLAAGVLGLGLFGVALVSAGRGIRPHLARAFAGPFEFFHACRGFRVEVQEDRQTVLVIIE